MKTAFACWNGRIAPVFDTAGQIFVVEADSGRILSETTEKLPEEMWVQKALRLVQLDIATLVCGAISRPLQGMVSAYGIEVIPFVSGDLRDVMEVWLCGCINRSGYAMPGCGLRRNRQYNGRKAKIREVYHMNPKGSGRGGAAGKGQGQGGRRTGRMGGRGAAGAQATCICPQCGHSEPHERGKPCVENRCPKCGAAMTRQ